MQLLGKTLLESIPKPLRGLIRPALFGSVGLHLLLLLMPIPERASETATSTETQVSLTRLPQRPSPSPSLLPKPAVKPVATKPVATPKPSTAQAQRAATPIKPQLQRPLASTQIPSVVQPKPQATPPQATPPQATPLQTLAVPTPAVTPAPSPEPLPPAIPFGDIPLLASSQTGCFGLGTCHQLTDGTNFRTAGQTLEQSLKAQGYSVKFRDDLEEAGREVYEITKNNETRYLNVLSTDLGSTVYLVTTQPISLNDLQNSTAKADLETILDQLSGSSASAAQFAQPEAFLIGATPRPETGGKLRLSAGSSPEQLLGSLTNQLQAQSFNLTEAGGYGGGLLYEVTKGAFTGYLNLVPTVDQSGTVVVLWTSLPN